MLAVMKLYVYRLNKGVGFQLRLCNFSINAGTL